jgi:hypothetical protein
MKRKIYYSGSMLLANYSECPTKENNNVNQGNEKLRCSEAAMEGMQT